MNSRAAMMPAQIPEPLDGDVNRVSHFARLLQFQPFLHEASKDLSREEEVTIIELLTPSKHFYRMLRVRC